MAEGTGHESTTDDGTRSVFGSVSRGAVVTFVGTFVGKALGFGSTAVITNLAGPPTHGRLSVALSVLTVALLVTRNGFRDAIVNYVGKARSPAEGLETVIASLSMGLGLAIVVGAAMIVFADEIARTAFSSPGTAVFVRWLGVALPLATLSELSLAATRGWNRAVPTNLVNRILFPVVKLVAVSVAVVLATGDAGIAVAVVGAYAVVAAAASVSVLRTVRERVGNSIRLRLPSRERYATVVTYAAPLVVSSGAWVLMNRIDTLLVGYYGSDTAVSVYAVAFSLATLFQMLNLSAGMLFFNNVSKLHSLGRLDRIRRLYARTTKWMIVGGVPLALLLFGAPVPVLRLFGPQFGTGELALLVLAVGVGSHVLVGLNGTAVKAFEATRWHLRVQFTTLVANVVLNLVLIPRYGIVGAAVATTVAYAASNVAHTSYLYVNAGIRPLDPAFAVVSVGYVAVGGFLIRSVRPGLAVSLALVAGLFVGYLAVLAGLGLLTLDEVRSVVREATA